MPLAVEREFGAQPSTSIQLAALSAEDRQYIRRSVGRLHADEPETIVLAQEINAEYAVLDDLLARRKAQRLDVRSIGTIGIILLSQRCDLLLIREGEETI